MERPQIEVYKTAYSEQMAGKISVPFKILIDVCDYALNLESQLHQEREKRAQAEAENTKLLKEGTIAMNGLFLLSQSIIRRGLVDDERCPECTRKPKFIHCLACQPGRWLEAGEEMYNDPETKAWSESAKEAAHESK